MINENRPLCILEPLTKYKYSDIFYEYGQWTLSENPYSESQLDWEACSATWAKDIGNSTFYVKCMEPAIYYVSIKNRGLVDSKLVFCEYHKPKILENL